MEFPKWASFTPEFASGELTRLLAAAERDVAAIEAARPDSYEGLVWGLDDATRELWRCWGMLSHMTSVMNSESWRKVEADFQEKVVLFSLRVGQSKAIYDCAKALDLDDPVRKRIVGKMVQSAELAGVALQGDKRERFNAIQARLAKLGTDFSNAVLDATKAFSFEKDGKTYTIDDANYPQTMKNCPDREVRERLCRARSTRAPSNTARIDEILSLRRELAGLLGYGDYAEMSLATKCAPSVAAVESMFDELDAATCAPASREEAELAPLAPEGGMKPWDVSYCAERLREKTYAYSEEELKKHFEFEDVLAGLFKLVKFLFGIDVEEVGSADKPEVWHPDVRFFSVKENGETIANFYVDPYVRSGLKSGGAWMNSFSNRCDRKGELPLALLALNQPVPDENGKCFMPFREVETLFHEFGHALQCMLTRIGEEGAAGINLVEWDAVEVASQFMENWCLDDRTGISVPEELKAKVKAAKNFRAATACRRQLALGKTDMALHEAATAPVPPKTPDGLKNEIFARFGTPLVDGDIFLNAFTHIFSGGYSAGYYGYKWSEVMSADCYGAFEEAGLGDDEAVKSVGKAYRETVLGLGGSESAYDVFVRFRGRKPNSAALLRQQGLA
ncbi:MAG: M3 family metallopeptidase [Kiritimatiellae bacterium]|nr:M3 family metallopeptidase [Kiritimatiellia bacterium]